MSGAAEPWWVAAFQSDYLRVYAHRDVPAARVEARWLVEHGARGRVLDLCCGFARHTLALRELGVDVYGVDFSADLLAHARELPGAEAVTGAPGDVVGRLARGDARALPYRDGAFDAVVNLFSSFGYFGDEGDLRVLDEIARVLAPGGLAVLDLMNPPRVRAGLVARSRTEREGVRLVEERALEDGGRRVVKHVRLERPSREVRTWTESVRMYEREEITALLAARGLVVEDARGGFSGEPAGPRAPRQILRARRAAAPL